MLTPLIRLAGLGASWSARRRWKQFESHLPKCRPIQNDLLLRIIKANADSDFGRKHDFGNITRYSDFTERVPITTYAYLEPYITRCRKGEVNALFGPGQKVLMYALTSGTTAQPKTIPVTEAFMNLYHRGWNIWGIRALSDHPEAYLRKILRVVSPADEYKTECGTPCGAISGMLAHHQKTIVRKFYATPDIIGAIADAKARYYTIMRLAIAEDVAFISTANPSTTLTLAQTAETHAEHMIRDLREGTLDNGFDIPTPIRNSLKHLLKKRPDRAKELEKIIHQHGRLMPKDYWNITFLANWTGGTLGMYLPKLTDYYGSVPIRDIGLLASEGRMSIPIEDNTPAGILDIESNLYEFIPVDEIDSMEALDEKATLEGDLEVLQGCQLEKGHDYYILLTNFAGLYRYHIGDRIRVTDHIGTTPVIEFMSKGAHVSSITGEKLTEHQVLHVVRSVSSELAISLESFVMMPLWDDPPHYRLYFESAQPLPREQLNQFAEMIDSRLMVRNVEYDAKRDSGRLGILEVRQVPPNYLAQHDQQLLKERHGHGEQFKHRYLYNKPVELE